MKILSKEIIIREALAQFEQQGYQRTTMESIAKAIGSGKSSLYYYFPNKELLFTAVLAQQKKVIHDRVKGIVDKEEGCKNKLKAFFNERVSLVKEYTDIFEKLYTSRSGGAILDNVRKAFYKLEWYIVREILKLGLENNEIRSLDINMTAAAIVMGFRGIETTLSSNKERYNTQIIADTMIDVVYFGISKNENPRSKLPI